MLAAFLAIGLIAGPPAIAHRVEKPLFQALRITHEEAVHLGEEIGIGSARIVSPDASSSLTVADFGEFVFEYTAGETAIETGGHVRILMRHVFHWSPPQITDPAAEGYTTVTGPDDVALEILPWPTHPAGFDLFLETFPWQHAIEVRVKAGKLKKGDKVRLAYGDRSGGGPGARIQPSAEHPYIFRVTVAVDPAERSLPLSKDLTFEILGGPAERLSLIAPSTPLEGQPIQLTLRAEDRYGNLATGFASPVTVADASGSLVWSGAFDAQTGSVLTLELPASGSRHYTAAAGAFTAKSNPVRTVSPGEGSRIWWGDIHGHTLNSDGRGTVRQFYTYCRDVAALDFCAVTDHGFQITETGWSESKTVTEGFHENHRFVTLHAYEWSGMTDVGGDHNVYYRGADPILFRDRSYYDPRNQQSFHREDNKIGHIRELNEKLVSLGERQVLTIPHFGGRAANPEWHEPRIERLIEVFSDHGRKTEWAYDFLKRGYRLGIIASSDNHTGRPGYGFLMNPLQTPGGAVEVGSALVAVVAPELTRDAVFDGLYDRRTYATTGDRILLDVHAGETLMGSEVTAPVMPPISIDVTGTANITRIEIVRDGQLQHTFFTDQPSVRLVWAAPVAIEPSETAGYWIHVFQANGEEAISSPIWWTRSAGDDD